MNSSIKMSGESSSIYDNVEPAEIQTGVPVFTPTMEQFKDFEKYMKAVNKFGMQSGIVKVKPPKEWVEALPPITIEALKSIKIRNPIVQHISGNNGVFGQQNIEKQRTFNIVQWKALSEQSENQPPAPRGKIRKTNVNAKLNKKILANKNHNDDALFKDFEYNIDTSEFTPERCEALEKSYWKSLLYAEPMYGADMIGSIFDETVKVWNVAHLPNVLDYMDQKLPGVNDAYLYAGLWKATFSWHLEDQDLYSINYIHFGAPKQWYSIPQASKNRFDEVMRDTFPQEYKNCHDFLRHKTFLVSPAYLEARGVTVNKIVHNEQEFMITYPYGYHAGMNFGYNVAESVNFAIEDWFEYGLNTTKCLCIADAVGIDVQRLIRRIRGEPEPESDIEPDTDPETEPEIENLSESEFKEDVTPKSIKKEIKPPHNEIRDIGTIDTKKEVNTPQKKRKTEKATKEQTPKEIPKKSKGPQCILCPNTFSTKQVKFHDFELIKTEEHHNGGKQEFCHRICSRLIPETQLYFDKESGAEFISGVSNIPTARKNLKCAFCHQKKGACFQCVHSKCTRAYHSTCSLPAGVKFISDDEFYCKFHFSKDANNKEYLSTLRIGDVIQAQFQDFFAGSIVTNNKSEHTFTIDLYPIGAGKNLVEVPYESVLSQGIKISKVSKKKKQKSPSPDSTTKPPEINDGVVQVLNLEHSKYNNSQENHQNATSGQEVAPLPRQQEFEVLHYNPIGSTYNTKKRKSDTPKRRQSKKSKSPPLQVEQKHILPLPQQPNYSYQLPPPQQPIGIQQNMQHVAIAPAPQFTPTSHSTPSSQPYYTFIPQGPNLPQLLPQGVPMNNQNAPVVTHGPNDPIPYNYENNNPQFKHRY